MTLKLSRLPPRDRAVRRRLGGTTRKRRKYAAQFPCHCTRRDDSRRDCRVIAGLRLNTLVVRPLAQQETAVGLLIFLESICRYVLLAPTDVRHPLVCSRATRYSLRIFRNTY